MTQGWVKLHRKLIEWPYFKKPDYVSVWVYLLLKATHKQTDVVFKGERITLKPGELITGRRSISEHTGVQEMKVQRILSCLQSAHQIEQQKSNRNRLISITYWDQYQDSVHQNEQPVNNHRTTDEQPVNTNKNVKNVKNENKNTPPPAGVRVEIWEEFLSIRKKLKAVNSDRALTSIKNKLMEFSLAGHDPNQVVEQSVINSWKGVFEPKGGQSHGRPTATQKLSTVDRADQAARIWAMENLAGGCALNKIGSSRSEREISNVEFVAELQ